MQYAPIGNNSLRLVSSDKEVKDGVGGGGGEEGTCIMLKNPLNKSEDLEQGVLRM